MVRFLIFLLVLLFSQSCNNNKALPTKNRPAPAIAHQYYFYPKANVYFDSANKEYLFLGNDGKSWQTAKEIPVAMQVLMDKKVFIASPADPVWKDNQNHKLIYSALLYASPADTQPNKAVKPVVIEASKPAEKKRSGFRRFFDKIFGRKKKDTTAR